MNPSRIEVQAESNASGLSKSDRSIDGILERLQELGWAVSQAGRWLVCTRPSEATADDALSAHAPWLGPFKLAHRADGTVEERAELILPSDCASIFARSSDSAEGIDPMLDDETRVDRATTVRALLERVAAFPAGNLDGLAVPSAEELASSMLEQGRSASVDKDQNLRMVLKRRGEDGQVRVERGPESVRYILRLGAWKRLPAKRREAMWRLACQANARIRIARIVWRVDGDAIQCNAIADLTGVPNTDGIGRAIYTAMIGAAISGLDLALRWLRVELSIVAGPDGKELSKWIHAR